jgi:hypothetical protein
MIQTTQSVEGSDTITGSKVTATETVTVCHFKWEISPALTPMPQ